MTEPEFPEMNGGSQLTLMDLESIDWGEEDEEPCGLDDPGWDLLDDCE